MLTRRGLLLAGGWLAAGAHAGKAFAGASRDEVLAALPGKRPLIQRAFRPPNFETPLAQLAAPFTPNDAFFVRYHLAVIPQVDPQQWRLNVGGPSAQRPLTLSLRELRSGFEQVSIAAVNQCSGNRRGLFSPRVPGVQWGDGAMGNALWRGVRLHDLLQRAGVGADALEVVFSGTDGPVLPQTPAFVKSLPLERALDENTLIAFEMNGRPLPHWNGAPARLVVPGWTGTYWMKHLTEIRIVPTAFDGFWMKGAYRLPTGAFPGAPFVSQQTPETTPITEILVNSLIITPVAGTRLRRGAHAELAGKAWDNGAGIEAVQVSFDGRRSWRAATLMQDLGRFAWREFRIAIDTSAPGPLEIAVRARSRNGTQQPDTLTFNPAGYHDNIVQTVSVEVT
ncbi:MAG TPA: molybdopterin-dependent oxidoreductase [Steroidobacteraceae bacterium]|jgi:DMSO/TMAO reductase YedYZ molybdopterin-dependent catalytic subunit|nr:molybdopterin-dependent oxidoreductase [Steroidobacteraceae bacterium]